jgi:hypothetical protein
VCVLCRTTVIKQCEITPPKYNHIRTFAAVCTSILSSAPGTAILSIDGEAPELTKVTDIPIDESIVNIYYDSPHDTKLFIYHARIYISAIKPFCYLMLNGDFTKWLKAERMILEVNKLREVMASNVGIFFFSHPRASLAHIQELYLQHLLGKPEDAQDMRIKPWFAHSVRKVAYTFLVQTNPLLVDQLNSYFEDASGAFPHEYMSWAA